MLSRRRRKGHPVSPELRQTGTGSGFHGREFTNRAEESEMAEQNNTGERVGFIGLGMMGHGMAKNIVEKGYPLTVMAHRNRAPVEDLVARGATEAATPKDVGAASTDDIKCE